MKTSVTTPLIAAQRALSLLLARANGGIMPDTVALHVHALGEAPPQPDCGDTRDALVVAVGAGGRLEATVRIATHFAPIVHRGFRFAMTPSGELVLLGTHRDMPMFFFLEDGRLCSDRGSPLLTAAAEREAKEAFVQDFVSLLGEVR